MRRIVKQYIAKCNSNLLLSTSGTLLVMPQVRKARYVVAKNLKRLMGGSTTLNTQTKVAERAGVKQRTVGYLLDPETTDMKSPNLETVEKVARAFGLETWHMLIDPDTFGNELSRFLQRPPVPDARLAELGLPPLTDKPRAVRGKHKGKRSLA